MLWEPWLRQAVAHLRVESSKGYALLFDVDLVPSDSF